MVPFVVNRDVAMCRHGFRLYMCDRCGEVAALYGVDGPTVSVVAEASRHTVSKSTTGKGK